MDTDDEDVLKSTDVARMFGVDQKTVTRWAASGKLPSFRTPTGRWRFYKHEVLDLITEEK